MFRVVEDVKDSTEMRRIGWKKLQEKGEKGEITFVTNVV